MLLLLFNTTRTTSGPPSTGAAIAMDGGVADTQPAITQAVSRRPHFKQWATELYGVSN